MAKLFSHMADTLQHFIIARDLRKRLREDRRAGVGFIVR